MRRHKREQCRTRLFDQEAKVEADTSDGRMGQLTENIRYCHDGSLRLRDLSTIDMQHEVLEACRICDAIKGESRLAGPTDWGQHLNLKVLPGWMTEPVNSDPLRQKDRRVERTG